MRSGKLVAHGLFEGERIPHPIETALWANFEIVVKPTEFIGHPSIVPIVIAQSIGASRTRLLFATVPAAKVKKLWPAAQRTAVAETRCQRYLVAEMNRSLDRAPKSKHDFLADCQERFPGLSARGFERAWAEAKARTGAAAWGAALKSFANWVTSTALRSCAVTTTNHRTEITAPVDRCVLFRDRIALIFARMRKRHDVQFALEDRLTVTIDRTAEVLDVGRSTVYELLRAGKLKSAKFGRAHRVIVQSIRDLIVRSETKRDPPQA